MGSKERNLLVIAISLTMIISLIASLGLPFFTEDRSITLPTFEDSSSSDSTWESENEDFTLLRVTTSTVQDVIASLERDSSHYRELNITRFWGSGSTQESATDIVLIWTDEDYSQSILVSTDGTMEQSLVSPDETYLWYSNSTQYLTFPTGDYESDVRQNIPSYEDILDLDTSLILKADFEEKLGDACIFVESYYEPLDYTERFWVSVERGILIASETECDGVLIYRMQETEYAPLTQELEFSLPDGIILHTFLPPEIPEDEDA